MARWRWSWFSRGLKQRKRLDHLVGSEMTEHVKGHRDPPERVRPAAKAEATWATRQAAQHHVPHNQSQEIWGGRDRDTQPVGPCRPRMLGPSPPALQVRIPGGKMPLAVVRRQEVNAQPTLLGLGLTPTVPSSEAWHPSPLLSMSPTGSVLAWDGPQPRMGIPPHFAFFTP